MLIKTAFVSVMSTILVLTDLECEKLKTSSLIINL